MDHAPYQDPRSDGELLVAVADGSPAALEVLYHRHVDWLAVRLGRRCSDAGVVDEVLQDTFVAAWKGATRYTGEGEVAAWLWGIGIRDDGDLDHRRTSAGDSVSCANELPR